MSRRLITYDYKFYQWKSKYGNYPLVNYTTSYEWEGDERVTMILKVVGMYDPVPRGLWGMTSDGFKVKFCNARFHWPDEWMGRVVLVDGSWDGEDFVVEEWLKMEDGTDMGEYNDVAEETGKVKERENDLAEAEAEGAYEE